MSECHKNDNKRSLRKPVFDLNLPPDPDDMSEVVENQQNIVDTTGLSSSSPMSQEDGNETSVKRGRGRPPGSGKKQLDALDDAMKKKRAAPKDIARIALEDLSKYFDVPILEASKNLNIGLTVLKRKCREFGIPRWPHRKIKSLDSLIRDLQEEEERQREENKAAAMAVAKRHNMLKREKENIENKPCMEIQSETKRFRQDVFKRRHRARALKL